MKAFSLIAVFILLVPTYSFAQCKTDQSKYWICSGDRAWGNGYLVNPDKMKELIDRSVLLDEVLKQRDEYRILLEESEKNKDEYKKISDGLKELLDASNLLSEEYKSDLTETESELDSLSVQYNKLVDEHNELIEENKGSWSGWEVGLLTSGVSVASALVGVGIYALVSD